MDGQDTVNSNVCDTSEDVIFPELVVGERG